MNPWLTATLAPSIPLPPQSATDVEDRSREHMRRYLRHRLRAIDAQIQRVSRHTEAAKSDLRLDLIRWKSSGTAWLNWTMRSMREAISDALASL
ncbi:MAG: hypothetical protein KIS91_05115 [Anaerolineae bacterium]|nr:hypothetical protein [Anaerolineae bacterium]